MKRCCEQSSVCVCAKLAEAETLLRRVRERCEAWKAEGDYTIHQAGTTILRVLEGGTDG